MTFVLIDNSLGQGACCRLLQDPAEIICAMTPGEVASCLARLEHGLAAGRYAAGFFSYELGYLLEPRLAPLMPPARDIPLLWFGLFETASAITPAAAEDWLRARSTGNYRLTPAMPNISEAAYLTQFERVKEMIAAGDIYQMNLTFKARFKMSGCRLSHYLDLRAKQKVSYGALIETGGFAVLSVSPELFLSRRGARIETRPMKGTQARGHDAEADRQARMTLAGDEKQRAENLMIVDLMRNDLGRIAEIGSVRVSDLFAVETYPTLHQMTTTIEATLRDGIGVQELLPALFPPGSITGAPKIRAMELIRELESEARGVYTGAIGMIEPGGDMIFNVAIRTAVIHACGKGEIGIGSGVVSDSQGGREYAECLLKLKFFTDPVIDFQLIETMLFDAENGYWLLEEHMARLARSAAHFKFAFDKADVQRQLTELVRAKRKQRLRVRLLLNPDGSIALTAVAQPAAPQDQIIRYVISPSRLAPGDDFLRHKTTRRKLYDDEFAFYAQRDGADEVLYLNERGELSEGSRTTIFLELDGELVTPALSSGLLPGTLRASLIAAGDAREAILTLDDLEQADAVYLGNSVRGLQRAGPLETRKAKPAKKRGAKRGRKKK